MHLALISTISFHCYRWNQPTSSLIFPSGPSFSVLFFGRFLNILPNDSILRHSPRQETPSGARNIKTVNGATLPPRFSTNHADLFPQNVSNGKKMQKPFSSQKLSNGIVFATILPPKLVQCRDCKPFTQNLPNAFLQTLSNGTAAGTVCLVTILLQEMVPFFASLLCPYQRYLV